MTAYPPCPRSKMQIHDSAVKAVFPGPVQLLQHAVYAHFMDYQIPVLRGIDITLQNIIHPAVHAPGQGGCHAVGAYDRLVANVHHNGRTRAVCCLNHSLFQASLSTVPRPSFPSDAFYHPPPPKKNTPTLIPHIFFTFSMNHASFEAGK